MLLENEIHFCCRFNEKRFHMSLTDESLAASLMFEIGYLSVHKAEIIFLARSHQLYALKSLQVRRMKSLINLLVFDIFFKVLRRTEMSTELESPRILQHIYLARLVTELITLKLDEVT